MKTRFDNCTSYWCITNQGFSFTKQNKVHKLHNNVLVNWMKTWKSNRWTLRRDRTTSTLRYKRARQSRTTSTHRSRSKTTTHYLCYKRDKKFRRSIHDSHINLTRKSKRRTLFLNTFDSFIIFFKFLFITFDSLDTR